MRRFSTGINTVGFDASVLIQYAMPVPGSLPRSSGQMYRLGRKVLPQQAQGRPVLRPRRHAKRVALYLGKGQMLEVVVQVSAGAQRHDAPGPGSPGSTPDPAGAGPASMIQQAPVQQRPINGRPSNRRRSTGADCRQQAPVQPPPFGTARSRGPACFFSPPKPPPASAAPAREAKEAEASMLSTMSPHATGLDPGRRADLPRGPVRPAFTGTTWTDCAGRVAWWQCSTFGPAEFPAG